MRRHTPALRHARRGWGAFPSRALKPGWGAMWPHWQPPATTTANVKSVKQIETASRALLAKIMKLIAIVRFGLAVSGGDERRGSRHNNSFEGCCDSTSFPRNLSDNLSRITNSIHDCARQGARVVVFPECALTGYFEDMVTNLSAVQITTAAEQVAQACRQIGVYGIVGTAWREGEKLFNSALIIAPTGKVIERYDKFQLAERWPQAGITCQSSKWMACLAQLSSAMMNVIRNWCAYRSSPGRRLSFTFRMNPVCATSTS